MNPEMDLELDNVRSSDDREPPVTFALYSPS
jgi:hypothetical protein